MYVTLLNRRSGLVPRLLALVSCACGGLTRNINVMEPKAVSHVPGSAEGECCKPKPLESEDVFTFGSKLSLEEM